MSGEHAGGSGALGSGALGSGTPGSDSDLQECLRRIAAVRPALAGDMLEILVDEDVPPFEETVTVAPARDGTASLRLGTRWIHSSVAPTREAQRLAANPDLPDGSPDGTLVIGTGLGYLFEAIDRRPKEEVPRPWVAVTFDPRLLRAVLLQGGSERWIEWGPDRLIGAWHPDALAPILRSEDLRTVSVIRFTGEARLFPERREQFEIALSRYRERVAVNRNTLRRFGALWVRNTIRTNRLWGMFRGIEPLADLGSELPAVVCAAGPTLDDAIPVLADAADRTLIIAVDTAVVALAHYGIAPDIAVIADPQYWNTRHLDAVDDCRALLVAEPATHPRTLRLWRGAIRMSASLFPLGSFFDSRSGRRQKLGAGGSVATSAWDLARVMGAGHIALAGADLGFPRYQTHCSGSFFETRLALRGHRLAPAEHGLWRYLHGAHATFVPSANGGTVPSDSRMQVYRSWFAEQNVRFPEIETVLLSGESSAIAGTPFQDPQSWIDDHGDADAVSAVRRTLATVTAEANPPATLIFNQLRESLQRLRAIASEGIAICDRLAHVLPTAATHEAMQELAALDAVDERIAGIADREIAGFVANEVLEGAGETPPRSPLEAVAVARTVYQGLIDAVDFHLRYVPA